MTLAIELLLLSMHLGVRSISSSLDSTSILLRATSAFFSCAWRHTPLPHLDCQTCTDCLYSRARLYPCHHHSPRPRHLVTDRRPLAAAAASVSVPVPILAHPGSNRQDIANHSALDRADTALWLVRLRLAETGRVSMADHAGWRQNLFLNFASLHGWRPSSFAVAVKCCAEMESVCLWSSSLLDCGCGCDCCGSHWLISSVRHSCLVVETKKKTERSRSQEIVAEVGSHRDRLCSY